MKPILRRLIEAGVIDKDKVQLMERWGQLDPGAAELVGTKPAKTKAEKADLAEELSELLDSALEEEPKEIHFGGGRSGKASHMRMGKYLIPILKNDEDSVFCTTEDRDLIYHNRSCGPASLDDGTVRWVGSLEDIYDGGKIVAVQVHFLTVH